MKKQRRSPIVEQWVEKAENDPRNAFSVLNRYYIEARYPLDMPVRYPVEEAQKAADLAYEIREFVRKLLR